MKFVIQRVKSASCTVDNQVIGEIQQGFCVFIGVSNEDNTEIADKLHVSMTTVWKWLKVASKLNLCNYHPVNKFKDSIRQVICTTTNETFKSITEASQKYNIPVTNISSVCQHKKHCKHAGQHPLTGERLAWMYLDEFNLLNFNNTKSIKEAM